MSKIVWQNKVQNKVVLAIALALFGLIGALLISGPNSAWAAEEFTVERNSDGDECKYKPAFGIQTVESENSFNVTLENLRAEITSRPLGIFGEVDHQANAVNAGLELGPTTLVIFGNPTVGTSLMQSNQAIGIELPLKMLVWEDDCGVVRIDYNRPFFLRQRFKIKDKNDVFKNVRDVLDAIATGAAEASEPYPAP